MFVGIKYSGGGSPSKCPSNASILLNNYVRKRAIPVKCTGLKASLKGMLR